MFLRDGFIPSVERKLYFFFLGVDLVCDNALPATDFESFEELLLFKILEALEAMGLLVSFLLAISSPPFKGDEIIITQI
mgnify:CR=1 FL=1